MEKEIIKDIIEWDIHNWSQALTFWSENIDVTIGNNHCLELGGRKGGPSLWLAINGNNVICSDLESPEKEASLKHKKYSCANKIKYEAIDATNIPYENTFDIVVFKSILGGISRDGDDKLMQKTIDQIYKSLKPSGKLLFAENLEASSLHDFLRKRFVKWGGNWNYLKYKNINPLFSSFDNCIYETVGFFGALGRTEFQRKILGIFDSVLKPIIPKKKRYIVFGIAEKKE